MKGERGQGGKGGMKEVVLVHFACGHLDDARDREKECVWGGVGSLLLRFPVQDGWLLGDRYIHRIRV